MKYTAFFIVFIAVLGGIYLLFFNTKHITNSNTSKVDGPLMTVPMVASTDEQVLSPTKFHYDYRDDKFGRYDIADAAEAYSGDVLVGRAFALELQDSPSGGPRIMKIQVTHLSPTGKLLYNLSSG